MSYNCKAENKKGNPCKNKQYSNSEYCYIHNINHKSPVKFYKNPKIHFVFVITGILLTLYFGLSSASRVNQEKLSISIEELQLNISSQELKYYPGRVFIILALFRENPSSGSPKYIFDFGKTTTPNKARLYAYLDKTGNLVFEMIDAVGNKHSITVRKISEIFEYNRKYLWFFEYGSGKYESYIRVFANGKLIGEKSINYKINVGSLKEYNEFTLGASLQGYFPGYFDCWMQAITKVSFIDDQKRKMLNIIYSDEFRSLFSGEVPEWAAFLMVLFIISIIAVLESLNQEGRKNINILNSKSLS